MTIGGSQTSGHEFNGQIDEVRFWSTVRTDDQIAANYNQAIANHPDLIANYHFDPTTGAIADSAGGHDGTAVGNAAIVETFTPVLDSTPSIHGNTVAVQEDGIATGRMTGNDVVGIPTFGVQGGTSAGGLSTLDIAGEGTVTVDEATGQWEFVPLTNFHGTTTFTLTAAGGGLTDSEAVNVVVAPVDHDSVNMPGAAMQFGGPFDRMTADFGTGTVTNQITIEAKVRFGDLALQQNVFGLFSGSDTTSFQIFKTAGNELRGFSSVGSDLPTGFVVQADTWYDVAATYDGTTVRVYVDGTLIGSEAVAGLTFSGKNAFLTVGGNPLASPYFIGQGPDFKGTVDEVRVWNVVRPEAQIEASRGAQLAGNEIGL